MSKSKNLLADRNHGVLLTAITLVTEMCQIDPNCLAEFRNVRTFSISFRTVLSASRRPSLCWSDTSRPWLRPVTALNTMSQA